MGMPDADSSVRPAQGSGEDADGGLLSATQAQVETLKRLVLETTESAAAAMLSETRDEGQRRIDSAAGRAQGIAQAVDTIEGAEMKLEQRAQEFTASANALKAELDRFAAILDEGRRWLGPQLAEAKPSVILADPSEALDPAPRLAIETGREAETEDDEPPTAAELGDFIRDHEKTEQEIRIERREAASRGRRRTDTGAIRRYFVGPARDQETTDAEAEAEEDPDPEPAAETSSGRRTTSSFEVLDGVSRDFLAIQLGGALVGLAGTAALLRFVIL